MDTLISSEKLIKELNCVLESERQSLQEFQELEVETKDEYLYEGAVDAIEGVLGIIEDLKQK